MQNVKIYVLAEEQKMRQRKMERERKRNSPLVDDDVVYVCELSETYAY